MWHFLFGVWLGSLLTRSGSGEEPPENRNDDGCLGCAALIIAAVLFVLLFKSCGT